MASTSSFLACPQTGWRGKPVNINGCGLHTIRYNASYRWNHNGQSGHLFNNSTSNGDPALLERRRVVAQHRRVEEHRLLIF